VLVVVPAGTVAVGASGALATEVDVTPPSVVTVLPSVVDVTPPVVVDVVESPLRIDVVVSTVVVVVGG
jgi:hypothetical protein